MDISRKEGNKVYVRFGGSGVKECPECQRILPLTDYHRNQRRPDGHAFYCKRCANERMEQSRRRRGIKQQRRPNVPVPAGMKWCPDCDSIKPIEDFPRTTAKASGRHSYCKPCHQKRSEDTADRLYGGTREYHLRRRYGIGDKEFRELLAAQGGVCAICGKENPQHVDHDHETGYIRGVLCFNCNGGLGHFQDDVARMNRAIDYLRATACRVPEYPYQGVYRLRTPQQGMHPVLWAGGRRHATSD